MAQLDKRIIDLTVADLIQILDDRYGNAIPSAPPIGISTNEFIEKMNVEDCAKLTGYVPAYVRQLVFKKLIPFYKIRRKLHFKRSEILSWMYKRKVTPAQELADQYVENNHITHKIR